MGNGGRVSQRKTVALRTRSPGSADAQMDPGTTKSRTQEVRPSH